MDPEILRELNDALRELENTLKDQASELSKQADELRKSKTAVDNNTAAVNNETKVTNNTSQSLNRYGQTMSAVEQELDRQNKVFGQNLKNTGRGLLDFGKALVSAETSLTKYGSSANQLGQSAWEVGKNFGLLGKVVGGLLAGLGLAANSILQLDQNIISFRDDFTKTAGVLPMTTENLGELAKEAGFAYNRMPMLSKAVNNLGENLLGLGGYAGESAVRFMRIADVGEDVRKKFSRMGLQQEDLLEYQSYYIELQKVSGQSQANRRKTDKQIQQESLAYAENLMVLSALTGEKASTIKDREQAVTATIEEQVKVAQENRQIQQLEALDTDEGRAEAGKIRKEQLDRQARMRAAAAKVDVEFGKAVGKLDRLGGYSTDTAGHAVTNLNEVVQTAKNTGDTSKFIDEATDNQLKVVDRLGMAAELDTKVLGEMGVTMDPETMNRILRQRGLSEEEIRKKMQEAGLEGTSQLSDAAAGIQELEIEASKKFQSFLETIDPLRHGFNLFKDAAIAAAAVIGGGALLGGVAKLLFGKFGKLGSPSNPMHAKIVSGKGGVAATAAGGIGTRLKSMFRRSAAPAAAATGAGKVAKGAGALAGSATGAGALTAVAGSPGGSKVGIFLTGLAAGLRAFGNPGTLKAAGILSAVILVVGGAVAGATWMIGKSLPSLAEGLKSFDEVDGTNLKKIGIGMAGLGAGLLAIGGEGIVSAMGNLAKWASGDKSNPIDKLQIELTKFQNMKVDQAKVEKNSKAFIAFNEMVAKATEINGTVAGALSRAFSSFFEVEIPLDKFQAFSEIDINAEQVEKNATAFKLFSEAMSSYKGYGTLSSLRVITSALAGNLYSFYQALPSDDPIKRFEQFSKIKIEGDQIKTNAIAFKDFANALAEYKGGPGAYEALSQLAGDWIKGLFGVDGPIESFKKFAGEDFGPNMERNVEALTKYANATTSAGGGSFGGGASGSPGGGSTSDTGGGGAGPSDTGGTASITNESVGLGEPGSSMKGISDIRADSGVVPDISSSKDELINYAKTLSIPDRAKFLQSLSSQAMQRASASAASGNKEASDAFLSAANRFYMLSKSTESMSDTGSTHSNFGAASENDRRDVASGIIKAQGKTARVDPQAAPAFQKVLDKMTQVGYKIKSLGGQVDRNIAGTGTKSAHSRGWAIDVNPQQNPDTGRGGRLITDMPSEVVTEAKRVGLGWGGDWKSKKDAMHFSAQKNEGGWLKAANGGIFTGVDTVPAGIAEAQKVGSLDPSSLIAKMGKTTVEEVSAVTKEEPNNLEVDLTPELLAMIEGKLEKVLFALENNQDTHDRILKNSM
jgi:hypothetical protein